MGRHLLLETTEEQAKWLLNRALSAEPRLTHFGIGIPAEGKMRRESPVAAQKQFDAARQMLAKGLEEIAASADWIRRQDLRTRFNAQEHSFGYKSRVEVWFAERSGANIQVSNGSFIAAALGLGLDARRVGRGSPNVEFKFSASTLCTPRSQASPIGCWDLRT